MSYPFRCKDNKLYISNRRIMNSRLNTIYLMSLLTLVSAHNTFCSLSIKNVDSTDAPTTGNTKALRSFCKRKKIDITKTNFGTYKKFMDAISERVHPDISIKDRGKDLERVKKEIFDALYQDVEETMSEKLFKLLLRTPVICKYNAIRDAMEDGDYELAESLRNIRALSEEDISDEFEQTKSQDEDDQEIEEATIKKVPTIKIGQPGTITDTPKKNKITNFSDVNTPKDTPNTKSLVALLKRKKIDIAKTDYKNVNSLQIALSMEVTEETCKTPLPELEALVHEKLFPTVQEAMTEKQFKTVVRSTVSYKYGQMLEAVKVGDSDRAKQLTNNTENGEIPNKYERLLKNKKVQLAGGITAIIAALIIINRLRKSSNNLPQTV